jgi:transposase
MYGSCADSRIGSANTMAFELYVEQVLAPSLHAGLIVVMDNLQAHKSARVKQAIAATLSLMKGRAKCSSIFVHAAASYTVWATNTTLLSRDSYATS